MSRFAGQVAVITGAGRHGGLGEAIARRLASEGATIVLSDIGGEPADTDVSSKSLGDGDSMESVAAALRTTGAAVSVKRCDVRSWPQVKALADHALDVHGRLDIWVNNAGIGFIMKRLLEVEPDDWQSVIDVNLTGAFNGLKAAAAIMISLGRGGRIVNIASQAAKSGFPFAQAYCSSKHRLVGLVRSAAIELGPYGITVNNVCPNHVTTGLGAWQNEFFAEKTGKSVEQYVADMKARIPLGRLGLPDDTAGAVAYLCSEDARYITAESLNVSGGEEPH